MKKRRWNDDLEVEERKIEDQARQRRAVAVYWYLLLPVSVSGIVAFFPTPPGEVGCKGLADVSTCVVVLKVLAQYSVTAFGIGMHVYITFEVRYLYCILSCLQSTMSTYTHTHTYTVCVPPGFQAALFFFFSLHVAYTSPLFQG